MIKNWQASAGALSLSDDDLRKTRRRANVAIRILTAVFTLLYIGILALGGWELLTAWRSGQSSDWRGFWDSAWLALRFSPFLLLSRADVWRSVAREMQSVAAARQAAVAGDDTHAPRVDPQPAPPVSYSLTPGISPGPLRQPLGTRLNSWIVMLILSILFGLMTALLGGLLVGTAGADTNETLAGFIVLGVAAFLLLLCALTIWRIVALTRPFFVEADDWGLRWREAGRRGYKKLPWHEAQAFIVLRNSTTGERPRRATYALVGREVSLAWRTTATDADSAQHAHERLAGLIVGRTKLPLRDITADVETAQSAQDADPMTALETKVSAERKRAELAAHLALSQSPHLPRTVEIPAVPPVSSTPNASAQRGRPQLGCLITLLALLPSLALLGAGWGLQQFQQQHVKHVSLPSQVHAQQPLFADRLSYDDGQWPVADDNPSHQSWFYQNGAYHLKGASHQQLIEAPGAPSYGDVAVEVTAAQIGASQDDGVGLLLRLSGTESDRIAFVTAPDGAWWIARYHWSSGDANDWTVLGNGYNLAINPGEGAQNRLLVIMRGTQYLCFVNEHYLGSYQDHGPTLLQGRMGVFVNDSTTEGMFSDFAVYPAPPTDPLPFT